MAKTEISNSNTFTETTFTKNDYGVITAALELLKASYERKSNMKGTDNEIQAMYKSRMMQTASLINKIQTKELEL